jgi:hypothetical protein
LTVSAQWKLQNSASTSPYIKGLAKADLHTGIDIPQTQATLDSTGFIVTLPVTIADSPFPTSVSFFSDFVIDWWISFDGGNTWEDAGTSSNPIYVCLGNTGPNNVSDKLYRTEVHLACSVTGAITPDQAMQNTWSIFSNSTPTNPNAGPKGITRWDGTPLYYYQLYPSGNSRHFGENAANSVGDLLGPTYGGSGQCGVWAQLLADAWTINGIVSTVIDAQIDSSSGYQFFWVNSWTVNSLPGEFTFPTVYALNDMLPIPSGGNYGALTKADGAAGQNSPTPSEKCWGDHAFVQYGATSLYYDPSYGLIHTSPADLQATCILCFGKFLKYDTYSRAVYSVNRVSTTIIHF